MQSIPDNLRSYVPASFFQGADLKPGITVDEAVKVAEGIQAKAGALPPAQAEIFLAMVNAPDLAPGGRIPENLGDAIDALGDVAARVGPGTPFEDSMSVLARAMIEQAAENRQNALQDRLNARQLAKGELLNQATSLTNQANELRDGAKDALIVACVFAAVSITASIVSIGGGVKSMNAGGAADKVGGMWSGVSQSANTLAMTSNQVGQAGSGYATTDSQASAKELEAQGQIAAATAQELQNQADLKKEMQDSMADAIKSIINFLKELADAKAQQMQALTRV